MCGGSSSTVAACLGIGSAPSVCEVACASVSHCSLAYQVLRLSEPMAPSSSPRVGAFRACVRNRDPNDPTFACEAPASKRFCAAGLEFSKDGLKKAGKESLEFKGGQICKLSEVREAVPIEVDVVRCEASGPATPPPREECDRKPGLGWDSLEPSIMARISRSLSTADLCRMSQVSKHYQELCTRDDLWECRAAEKGFSKAVAYESWLWNYKTAISGVLHASPLTSVTEFQFCGDVAIVDPFELFFAGKSNKARQAELKHIVREFKDTDLVLTYRGVQSVILRASCAIDDDESAFEVFRGGDEVGANVTSSGVVAVVPKKLVDQFVDENGGLPLENAVIVVGVNGVLRSSLDGDFILRHPEPVRGTLVEVPYSGEMDYADVVCSTGGSWTEDSDSEYDDEELTEEEMAEAMQELEEESRTFNVGLLEFSKGKAALYS